MMLPLSVRRALFFCAAWIFSSAAMAAPWMGSGAVGDPYQISTATHLTALANHVNGGGTSSNVYWKLMNDIDLSGETITPIGSYGNTEIPFSGTFDGNGHMLRNFTISSETDNYVSIFSYIKNATIKNLGVVGFNVIGVTRVAGLVGRADGSTITNCYAIGAVTALSPYTTYSGLLVGHLSSTKKLPKSAVTNCYALGTVHCSSTTGVVDIGGLIGHVGPYSDLTNDYTVSTVTSAYDGATAMGALVGGYYNSTGADACSVTNCYYKSGALTDSKATPLTAAQLLTASSFTNWDFTSVWTTNSDQTYPQLRNLAFCSVAASAGSNGTISPNGTLTMNPWTDVSFTITPSAGYTIGTLTVDGMAVTTSTSYNFTRLLTNHTIAATFVADVQSVPVSFSAGTTGATLTQTDGSPLPSSVERGTTLTVRIHMQDTFNVVRLTANGVAVTIDRRAGSAFGSDGSVKAMWDTVHVDYDFLCDQESNSLTVTALELPVTLSGFDLE